MNLAAVVGLLLLADPAPTPPPDAPASRSPLKRKIDPAAEKRGLEAAGKIEAAMRANRAYDGKFEVTFDRGAGRVLVAIFGGKTSWGAAREKIAEVVATTSTLADPDVSIAYVFDGPCSGDRGHEVVRREGGQMIERPATKTKQVAEALEGAPLTAALLPCLDENR